VSQVNQVNQVSQVSQVSQVNQVNQVNQVSQSSPYKSSYRSEIDGLRAFAVLSVVAFHAFPSWLKGGFIGVDVFFVISGFLITSHIFENLDKGQFSFTDFFGRRIRRIFPALILVMACSLAFGWFALLADEFAQLGKHVASGAVFIANFILVDESGYFDNAAETKPMLHLWSLAVEEQFYIVWPLVLWLAWKRKFNLLTITVLVAVISFYLNLCFVKSHPTETFFWPVGRFWELLSGSILAWLLLYKSDVLTRFKLWIDKFLVRIIHSKEVVADGSTTSNLMSFFGLLLLAYGVIRINESLSFPSKWALIPVLGAVLIIASGSKAWLNRIFLMNPIAVWFGLISYPLYLWHWPILSFLQIVEGEMPHRDARILAVLLSIFLAWVTYRFIELPIRFGVRRGIKSVALIGLIAIVGSMGFFINKIDGLTPYNQKLKYVSDAKGDWEYPKGLTRNRTTSNKPSKILVFGDSHIEALAPRIIDMYKDGLTEEVAFVTMGGCAPLPNTFKDKKGYVERCSKNFDNFNKVLSSNPIETIIVGGAYVSYFLASSRAFYLDDDGSKISLSSEDGRRKSIDAFYHFLNNLTYSYKVVIVGQAPYGKQFSPSHILSNGEKKRRSIPLRLNLNVEPFMFDNSLESEMKTWFSSTDVTYVSQSDKICPNNVCVPLTIEGKPKFKDKYHLRPFFVKEYMDVLDPYVLLSK
jgi:peptidoglycan/LPS O-acetylase OafA/YrhL